MQGAPTAAVTDDERGRYRVLPGRNDDERQLLAVDGSEVVAVPATAVATADVGNVVAAGLGWETEPPAVRDVTVETATRFRFERTTEAMFEAARNCFERAQADGEAMNSRVTHGTDGDPNGVVYTFAEQPGEQDLFAEFRDGTKPLEPLVARAADGETPPFSVWVLDPEPPFVAVYIVLDPDGLLEQTMRETYLGDGGLAENIEQKQ
ncbi:uncharacterized protein NP_0514A [Natronomonas pharaonis DSM 2160]|uniref:Uncharacterized protein n=1 Tax=Natronomonas pharaonis (strain ATCC 35678 / DSM 2160 / CIP 103997 / JCM 8858 / NBRC 14720 / NCIMB 2260 / Gabara) TaxID=348780 RepID=A0A1U7ETU5_NATPD|nr:DUF6663 family protein [Natronomonas pharaonis]CAI48348.1 uncharacterized protein NP_0514A [Natronomonas pharaonis DSM 2160]